MLTIVVLFSLFLSITTVEQNATARVFCQCTNNTDCVHGTCTINGNDSACVCDRGWTLARDGCDQCTYEQKSKLTAFLLSFFLGFFGADWFYLSAGNGGYIAAGVFKLLTGGGLGIWWLVDWIRILANAFSDGQGVGLVGWN